MRWQTGRVADRVGGMDTDLAAYTAPAEPAPPDAVRAEDKPLLDDADLPGPLSLHLLSAYGMLSPLDNVSAYQVTHASTLYGRAAIAAALAPRRTVACAFTAAWIWLGGDFPNTIDIISRSHYRSVVHGRRIRVFNRKSRPEHIIKVGAMRVTTPARTACDLALLPSEEVDDGADRLIEQLMLEYRVTPEDCLAILEVNRFWPRAPLARDLFERLGI